MLPMAVAVMKTVRLRFRAVDVAVDAMILQRSQFPLQTADAAMGLHARGMRATAVLRGRRRDAAAAPGIPGIELAETAAVAAAAMGITDMAAMAAMKCTAAAAVANGTIR